MIDAILTAFCIAVGVGTRHYDLSFCKGRCSAVMIIQFIVSLFCHTLFFAELFGAPKKELFFCGLTGAIGWVVYVIGLNSNMGTVLCESDRHLRTLTVFSRILSAIRRNPVTIYLIAGIFPLVPGAGIYYTSYYFIMNDMTQFSNYGMETIKVAGAIVLGIVFGFGLPQSWFNALQRIERKRRLCKMKRYILHSCPAIFAASSSRYPQRSIFFLERPFCRFLSARSSQASLSSWRFPPCRHPAAPLLLPGSQCHPRSSRIPSVPYN